MYIVSDARNNQIIAAFVNNDACDIIPIDAIAKYYSLVEGIQYLHSFDDTSKELEAGKLCRNF